MNEQNEEFDFNYYFNFYSDLFVQKINEAIIKSGLTKEKLGMLLKRSPNAIYKWQKGHNIPSTVVEKLLCKIFKVDPSYFFNKEISFEEARERADGSVNYHILEQKITNIENRLNNPNKSDKKEDVLYNSLFDQLQGLNKDQIKLLLNLIKSFNLGVADE